MSKVLIIDDRITNRRILCKLAGELDPGIEVEAFPDPAEALAWLADGTADLVITDYKMPSMDGANFIAALRKLPHCADVPVVVVTAYEDKEYRYAALHAGATDFLLSPVDHEEFRSRIRNLLTMQRQRLLIRRRLEQLELSLEKSNRLHRSVLRESEEKLRLVINAVPAMISAVNAEHRFVFMNNFEAWLLGIDPNDAVNRTADELLGTEYGQRSRTLERQVFETGQSVPPYEETFEDATGRTRTLLTTKAPLRDTSGEVSNVVTTSVDIPERKQTGLALQEQRNFLRTVLDVNPSYIFALDQGGVFVLANNVLAAAFGTTPDQVVGARPTDFAPVVVEGEAFMADCARVITENLPRLDVERRFTDCDGRQHWLQTAYVPLARIGGRPSKVLAVCADVSALKEAEATMREAKQAAERSNRSRANFLANMSHELRTPLNAIIGFSEMISGEVLDPVEVPKYREYAQDIQSSATHLLAIIGDILDLSKIEAGRITLHETEVDVAATIEAVCAEQADRAVANDIALVREVAATLPLLRADAQRLRQVLHNVLSNALKFTPPGGRVTVAANAAADGALQIYISDSGIGMDEEEIPVALTHFGQIEQSLTRSHEGTGLGLPLSVAFLGMHGAHIDISSRKGQGTTVAIMFPAERSVWREVRRAFDAPRGA
jgi:PAS domain S-box-containing protein